jgi:hypothetical protein
VEFSSCIAHIYRWHLSLATICGTPDRLYRYIASIYLGYRARGGGASVPQRDFNAAKPLMSNART